MSISTFTLVLAAGVVLVVLMLLRSRRLREKYAALWVVVGIATVVLAAFPGLLDRAAAWVGFAVPANLLFSVAILMLLGVCLHLSLELSNLEDETRTLAEAVAILDAEVRSGHGAPDVTDVGCGLDAAPRELDPRAAPEPGVVRGERQERGR